MCQRIVDKAGRRFRVNARRTTHGIQDPEQPPRPPTQDFDEGCLDRFDPAVGISLREYDFGFRVSLEKLVREKNAWDVRNSLAEG